MAVCTWCHQEMLIAAGCSGNDVVEYPDGEQVASIPFNPPDGVWHCGDCGVLPGRSHHPGCSQEICPRCGGQLFVCGCLEEEGDDPGRAVELKFMDQVPRESAACGAQSRKR
jgi:hypothetical protein